MLPSSRRLLCGWLLSLLLCFPSLTLAQTELINSHVVIVGHTNLCVVTVGATDAYACNLGRTITAYQPWTRYSFIPNVANTGPATLALNGLASLPIKKLVAGVKTDLVTGDIAINQPVEVYYDGSEFVWLGAAGVGSTTAASVLLGRGDSGPGAVQELTLGSNLAMTGTTLNATSTLTPAGGTAGQAQWNNAGAFAGSSALLLNATQIVALNQRVTALSTSVSLTSAHGPVIACTAGATDKTMTLPAVATATQSLWVLIKVDAGAGRCLFAPFGSEQINGTPGGTAAAATQNSQVQVILTNVATPNWSALSGKTVLEAADLPAASLTAAGIVELATPAETTTGTDAARAVTPDGLAGSDFGKRYVTVECVPDDTALTTGDGKCYFPVHADLNGWNIVSAITYVGAVRSTSGVVTVDIDRCAATAAGTARCSGTNVSLFTTLPSIDATEIESSSGTAAVINATNQTLATGQWLRYNVDAAGTGTQGLYVTVVLQKP